MSIETAETPRAGTTSEFERLCSFVRENLGRVGLTPEEQSKLDHYKERRDLMVAEAREAHFFADLDEEIDGIYRVVRPYLVKGKEDYVANMNGRQVMVDKKERDQILVRAKREDVESDFWENRSEDHPGYEHQVRKHFGGMRQAYWNDAITEMKDAVSRKRGFIVIDRRDKLWSLEEVEARERKIERDRKLWDRSELNYLVFKREYIHNQEDLEFAYRQFIRDTLSTGNVSVERVFGDIKPLGDLVQNEAIRIGLEGKEANRLSAEAVGRFLLFAADWFASIGKRAEVEQLMQRFTESSVERVLGLASSYDGLPLEAAALICTKSEEGLIKNALINRVQDGDKLWQKYEAEFKELGIFHPEKLRFQDFFQIDGPHGELYNNKIKLDKYQGKIKEILIKRLAASEIQSKDSEGKESVSIKSSHLELALLGLKEVKDARGNVIRYEALPDEEFFKLFSQRVENVDKFREGQAEEAVDIAMQLMKVFGYTSEFFAPRVWKREYVRYELVENGDYVFDNSEKVYVRAMKVFKTDGNGNVAIDSNSWPLFEKEKGPYYKRVQGPYVQDEDGHMILVSVEDLAREKLGREPGNNVFFPLDDTARTAFTGKDYPKPPWEQEVFDRIDPKGFTRDEAILPEQRDLLLRKLEDDWKEYIRTMRQLLLDYAQDASEYAGLDFKGLLPSSPTYASDPEIAKQYQKFVLGGFGKENKKGVFNSPGTFFYQKDILYGGGAPFAIKKDLYLPWWILGDPIQNMQKTELRSINLISLMDTLTRSVGTHYTYSRDLRGLIQGLMLKSKDNSIILDDYETQIWVGEYAGADDLRVYAYGGKVDNQPQTGFLHSFIHDQEILKEGATDKFYKSAQNPKTDWDVMTPKEQQEVLVALAKVLSRQFAFAAGYLAHNSRTSVQEEGKWAGVRFMNGVFDIWSTESAFKAYPDVAERMFILLSRPKLSYYGWKTPREVLLDLYVKNYS